MKQGAKGFTLIELIIVISIIGILAATALPRYIAAQSDARAAKANAVFGSMRAAAALAKARCELDLVSNPVGTCTTIGGTVNMDGIAVTMVNRYPTADASGIVAAAQMLTSDGLTFSGGGAAANVTIAIDINGGTAPNCRVTYTSSTAVGNAPVVTVATTGC